MGKGVLPRPQSAKKSLSIITPTVRTIVGRNPTCAVCTRRNRLYHEHIVFTSTSGFSKTPSGFSQQLLVFSPHILTKSQFFLKADASLQYLYEIDRALPNTTF